MEYNKRFLTKFVGTDSDKFRSSHLEVYLGKGVLKICSKFAGEHLCRSMISTKLTCNFTEITLWHGCSTVSLLHIFRIPFLRNTSGGLLMEVDWSFRIYKISRFSVTVSLKSKKQPSEVFYKKSVLKNFIKFKAKVLQLYLKRDSGTGVFQWILWNF